jgi:uncharacterized protein (TIGR02246 family)
LDVRCAAAGLIDRCVRLLRGLRQLRGLGHVRGVHHLHGLRRVWGLHDVRGLRHVLLPGRRQVRGPRRVGRLPGLRLVRRRSTAAAVGLVLVLAGGLVDVVPVAAQAGVPGGRMDTGAQHRAVVRAETYREVANFLAGWREAWNARDHAALARMYHDEASVRFPGGVVVQGRDPVLDAIAEAAAASPRMAMADVDFDSDGQTAMLVTRYTFQRDDRQHTGLATAVLVRAGRSWRLRMHVFGET